MRSSLLRALRAPIAPSCLFGGSDSPIATPLVLRHCMFSEYAESRLQVIVICAAAANKLCVSNTQIKLKGINYFGFENGQTSFDGLWAGPTALSLGAQPPLVTLWTDCKRTGPFPDILQSPTLCSYPRWMSSRAQYCPQGDLR